MLQIIAILLFVAAVAVVAKIAIIVLLIAGLIFRTKETIGLLILGGLLTFFNLHPVIAFSVAGLIGLIAFFRKAQAAPSIEQPASQTMPVPTPQDEAAGS